MDVANGTSPGTAVATAAAGAVFAIAAFTTTASPTTTDDASLVTSNLMTTSPSLVDDFVNATRKAGPPEGRYGFTMVVVIAITAGALSLITVIGNSMVMISFKIDKQLQTISNYFLFSLAVADLAIGLISMPLFTVSSLMGYWPLGPTICDAWLTLDYLNSNASVLNLLIISFDRYFSVTRPLTYRAKRTTTRAAVMIGCAWVISFVVWTPWIYSWPYIEGERTVPEYECYIQFIETNRYITFSTAIAAFYVPVTVMCILYWRIWRETEKRQKDLPNLQAGKKDSSKRSNSSNEKHSVPVNGANRGTCSVVGNDDPVDLDEWRRQRSESGGQGGDTGSERDHNYLPSRPVTADDVSYSGWKAPTNWNWLRRWCIAWYHAGREAEECDDTPSDMGYATPVSVETPLQSSVSRCTSLNVIRDPYAVTSTTGFRGVTCAGGTAASAAAQTAAAPAVHYDTRSLPSSARLSGRSLSSDSVYTILIRLPSEMPTEGCEAPSIKMIADDLEQLGDASVTETVGSGSASAIGRTTMRRPSQMPDIRIPLNAKIIPKQLASHGGSRTLLSNLGTSKPQVKKRKKTQEKKAERKAAKTLSAILLTFIITWTPYNILVLVKPLTSCADCIPPALWDFFYYLCYINSTINPMCYALCNASFRRTYVRILKCKWHNRNRTNRGFYN